MIANLEQEIEVLTQLLAFRNDPVRAVLYGFPFGREGTMFANFDGPRGWQLEELERIGEHVRMQEANLAQGSYAEVFKGAWSSGRGPGKTALFAMIAWWNMSCRIGAPVMVTANTESQMRNKTFPEFAVWFGAALNSHWFNVESMRITPQAWLVNLVKRPPERGGFGIDPRHWQCYGQTWNEDDPDAFAGAHNPYGMTLLMDEASGIPSNIWEVSEGFFTEENAYRFWMAASQMRSRQGRFYEIFYDPKQSKGWYSRTLSTRGMPGVDQGIVRGQIERYGEDSDFVRIEIDGLPPHTEEGQFIPTENFNLAKTNRLVTDPTFDKLIMGVDPAPRGKTSICFRQGRNARDCCGKDTWIELNGADNEQIAERIKELDRLYKPDAICIDFGMGTGVIDRLKKILPFPRIVHEVRFGMTNQKGTEYATNGTKLWAEVRDWLPGGMIPMDDGGKGSLTYQGTNRMWKWSGREDNQKILEPKQDMKKRGVDSPDDMDALAVTFGIKDPPRRPEDREHSGPQTVEGAGEYEFTI